MILWLLREPVAQWVFGDTAHAGEVGWLGLGVFFTLIAGSQTALLQGLRRIGDLARVNVISAFFAAVAGIALVYLLGQAGALWFVLVAPAISVLVASHYAARLPRPQTPRDWQAISQQWQAMLKLGIPFMVAGLLTTGTQLAARAIILRELGLDASGYFQAAWAISMTYIGFVLGAMGTDYFPRLTEAISDPARARKLVNEQTEMALLLAGPVLLAMTASPPGSSTCCMRPVSPPPPKCCAGRCWATSSRLPVGPWASFWWPWGAAAFLLPRNLPGTRPTWARSSWAYRNGAGQRRRGLLVCLPDSLSCNGVGCSPADRL